MFTSQPCPHPNLSKFSCSLQVASQHVFIHLEDLCHIQFSKFTSALCIQSFLTPHDVRKITGTQPNLLRISTNDAPAKRLYLLTRIRSLFKVFPSIAAALISIVSSCRAIVHQYMYLCMSMPLSRCISLERTRLLMSLSLCINTLFL